MMRWKCTIKTPSNYLQTMFVEAYTHSDAVAFVESQTGGKCIMATVDNAGTDDDEQEYSGESSGIDGGFVLLALAAFILIAGLFLFPATLALKPLLSNEPRDK